MDITTIAFRKIYCQIFSLEGIDKHKGCKARSKRFKAQGKRFKEEGKR